MKFGAVPLSQAAGAILAHSIEAKLQGKASRIPKGTVLTADHLGQLAAAGFDRVVVARLDPADIEENEAATRLAHAIVPDPEGQNIRIAPAGAGRVNLYAASCGVVLIDRAAVDGINAIDPMITLATVPPFHRVEPGGMIATIKMIAYAVAEPALERAIAGAGQALRVAPPVYGSATLIETRVTPKDPPVKGREALFGRLHRFGLTLSDRVIVPHDTESLARAIAQAPGEVVFILTASATSDIDDVAPAALRAARGSVTSYGMPVDPGNLLFHGRLAKKPVIGLPGCARSPALNGADWVLERLICGCDLSAPDIAAMGVGGLLKEIPTRPMPRRGA